MPFFSSGQCASQEEEVKEVKEMEEKQEKEEQEDTEKSIQQSKLAEATCLHMYCWMG